MAVIRINLKEKGYCLTRMNGVRHATLNPKGPGAVRIHLIPPRFGLSVSEKNGLKSDPALVILNGQYQFPIEISYAILLNEFLMKLEEYAGETVTEIDLQNVIEEAVHNAKKVYWKVSKSKMIHDLSGMVDAFVKIAKGENAEFNFGNFGINIGEYSPLMRGPIRMDLMISAMTQGKEQRWHCNNKCLHCYAAGQSQAGVEELSTAEWKTIIKKLYNECFVSQVTFTGGEPTMRNDLVELVASAKKLVTRLNTNGIRLTSTLCEQLFKASLDSVQITFYSSNMETHNKLVGAKTYEKTLEGIKNALRARLNVSINTPLCSINDDYIETLKFLHKLGIQYVTCSALIVTGNATSNASKNTQLSKNELKAILEEAAKFCAENDMEINFTSPGWLSEEELKEIGYTMTPMCGACLSNMAITPNGGVVPCQSWLSDEPLGNILNDEWDSIWNSTRCTKTRKATANYLKYCPLTKRNNGKGENNNA